MVNKGFKGSCFSGIKGIFICNAKKKNTKNGPDNYKIRKVSKRGKGIPRKGDNYKSFIPSFKQPSSIEKILGEADEIFLRPSTPPEHTESPNVTENQDESSYAELIPEPSLRNQQLSATKIQAAYRGFMARRTFRDLRGLLRLQGILKSENVRRTTKNALKQMHLFVRAQTQIQSQRIRTLENKTLQMRQEETTPTKWKLDQLSEIGHIEDWDDSVLTLEEVEERSRKKFEASTKRERAMTYAYYHKLWNVHPNSSQSPLQIRYSNEYPWGYSKLRDHHRPQTPTNSITQSAIKNATLFPTRPINSAYKSSPGLVAKNSSLVIKYSKPRKSAPSLIKDDSSIISYTPHYTTPTESAKAKVRAKSNPKERFPGTPNNSIDPNKRLSYPWTPNRPASRNVSEKHESLHYVGDSSVDSNTSL